MGAEETLESTRDSIGDKDIFARETKAAATKKELALHTLKKAAGSRQKMMVTFLLLLFSFLPTPFL